MKVHFSDNLKNLRKSKGLSQADLAKILGVDQRTVSAWENSICEPSFEMLAILCDIFEETFDGLLA